MLFGNSRIVLFINQNRITVGDCRTKFPNFYEIEYQDFSHAFTQIHEKFNNYSYKLILDSSVSYSINLKSSLIDLPTREKVYEELASHIPENFTNLQFDWRLDKNNQIEAVVITTQLFTQLQKLRSQYSDIKFSTQSLASISQEMGLTNVSTITPEIMLYASNKGNEKGRDSMILNIPLTPHHITVYARYLKYIIFIIILLSLLFFFINTNKDASDSLSPTPTPISSATPIPTPIQSVISTPETLRVLIQNGTEISGLAAKIQTQLQPLSFSSIEIGNAPENSTVTTISVNQSLSPTLESKLRSLLSPRTVEIILDSNQSPYDIVITLGTSIEE